MQTPKPPSPAKPELRDVLVLARDKVIREMLATCARSMGLSVHAAGSARLAAQAMIQGRVSFRAALLAGELEDAHAGEVAVRLVAHPGCGRVLGFGVPRPQGATVTYEERAFPIDFSALFVELRALTRAPEAEAQAA